jgi:hypothetical protein
MTDNNQPYRDNGNNKQEKNRATREIDTGVRGSVAQAAVLEKLRWQRMDG